VDVCTCQAADDFDICASGLGPLKLAVQISAARRKFEGCLSSSSTQQKQNKTLHYLQEHSMCDAWVNPPNKVPFPNRDRDKRLRNG
jgi:hypothetical protein